MKIVCLGDSITAGCNVDPRDCWVSLLQKETIHEWVNLGVNGDTSMGMLTRLNTEAFPLRPDMVLWLGGTNDLLLTGSDEQIRTAMMAMVNQCAGKKIIPIVGIPIPILEGFISPWPDSEIPERVLKAQGENIQWLRSFTKAFHLRFVDFCDPFRGHAELYQSDRLHPNADGHRIMADIVKKSRIFRQEERTRA